MKIASQRLMRFAAILAFTAASTSAFAQRTEYREGYKDAYVADQRSDEGRYDRDDGPRRFRLRIEQAEYGARGSMCDARRAVRHEVERNGGSVRATNQLCGDPARGIQKRLRVIYRCGNGESMRAVARENETLNLSCRRR